MCFSELITFCDKLLPGFVSSRIRFYFLIPLRRGFPIVCVAGVFAGLCASTQHQQRRVIFLEDPQGGNNLDAAKEQKLER
jgi:UPF0716 family protein affecting phage T7 exclusion